jgi:hypothetical protein
MVCQGVAGLPIFEPEGFLKEECEKTIGNALT